MIDVLLEPRVINDMLVLVPKTSLDVEKLGKIKGKPVVRADIVVPRNYKFHQKGFVLVSVIFDNMDDDTKADRGIHTPEMLRKRLTIETGNFDVSITTEDVIAENGVIPAGTPIIEPHSWSFGSMDNDEFEKVYKGIIDVAIGKYCTGQTEESINRQVDEILRFA